MENFPLDITSAERKFYGEYLILLEGVIEEFLSCVHMIRRYQVSQGRRDPIASFQVRIKSAESMKAKLKRQNLPVTADSALRDVWDAAGVRLICPFVDNLNRQRQFVTDASHELKTPLAILSADMGLLEDTYGKDQWLDSAQTQIVRLDKLIKDLVELARTEETVKEDAAIVFDLSEIAQASAEAFQPLAEADGKTLTASIDSEITLKGVQDNFFRLFSILLDNAVKYCDPAGAIQLTVSQRGRNICISVSNPCTGIDEAQLPRYFDRFYRADSSRDRATGGYGIGLSTAKAIVTRHRGRISNRYADGVITFTATIPQSG